MKTAGIEELLARFAKGPVERELGMFAALPVDKRRTVELRLRGIARYRADHGAGTSVAKDLGLTPRSLYRLAARVDDVGPVEALAPLAGAGRKKRSDVAVLPPAAEARLAALLAERPGASWSDIMDAVAAAGGPAPSVSAVRRRAMMLRREYVAPADAVLGRALLIDQIALDITTRFDGGEVRYLVADVMLDLETRLILGAAPADAPTSARVGRMGLLVRTAAQILRGLESPWRVADRIASLSWVVDDDVDPAAVRRVADIGAAMRPPVSVSVSSTGRFRRGTELIKFVGDHIHSVELLPRATVDPVAKHAADGFARPQVAAAAVRSLVRGWNGDLVHRVGWAARPVGNLSEPLLAQMVSLMSPLLGPADLKLGPPV